MIALITGIGGFVGPYLKQELESKGYTVYGLELNGQFNDKIIRCDITDFDSVYDAINKVKPDVVFHLAGFSSVAKSFENPELCFKINVDGTKNLLNAIIRIGIKPKILIVSSSEVYGKPKYNPIDELHPLDPVSPYGKSRVEQEELRKNYDLPIIISRSFNHTGPTQPDTFVIPSFKKQISEAKDGDSIYVGNLDVVKDFSDVRDVVRAYRILLEKGQAGEVYNVGSGKAYSLKKLLETLIKKSGKKIEVKIDPKRFRPVDIKEAVCDNRKLLSIEKIGFRKIV
jgi:GDP-4-dehydro-6-deoxy-D-mannose reductase